MTNAAEQETTVTRDPRAAASIAAGAIHAGARFLATYDRGHLLANADLIQAKFGIVVATPEAVLTSL